MLGVCLRLPRTPEADDNQPYLATVESAAGLRVTAVITPPHNVQVYSAVEDDAEGLELVADGLLRGQWPVPGVIAQAATAEAFASVWRRRTGARTRTDMRQGIYELRRVTHPTYPPMPRHPGGSAWLTRPGTAPSSGSCTARRSGDDTGVQGASEVRSH